MVSAPKWSLLTKIEHLSTKLSRLLVKIPTPYGWVTSYLYAGGLSYIFGRPSELAVLEHFKPEPGWTVLDAGANIGYYTLVASKLVGAKGKVICVEPEPRNFGVLCRNIRDNQLRNVLPLQVALGNEDGSAVLTLDASPAEHSIVSRSGLRRKITVQTRRIDSLMKELNLEKIDLIKIDVEGAELIVLQGGRETLMKGSRLIIEFSNLQSVEDYLTTIGYESKPIDQCNLYAWKTDQ